MTDKPPRDHRSNEEWIANLCGRTGRDAQQVAHYEIGQYLLKVVYSYLQMRQHNLDALASFASNELSELARDFVQETLEKLASNRFALLDKFHNQGRFLNWIAKIAINEARQELRKSYWTRRVSLGDGDDAEEIERHFTLQQTAPLRPETEAIVTQVMEALEHCMEKLVNRQRIAFIGCVVEMRDSELVAAMLDCTTNALHILIYRSKTNLKKCLARRGYDEDVLVLFDQK